MGEVGRRPDMSVNDVLVHASGDLFAQSSGRCPLRLCASAETTTFARYSNQQVLGRAPVEFARLGAESPRTLRVASLQQRSMSWSSTLCWHSITKIKMRVERGTRVPATTVSWRDRHRPMAGSGVMQVRYRYRIYPAPGQQRALARTFGCARVVYNDCLRVRDACYATGEKISDAEVQRRVITLAKREPDGRYYASFVVERAAVPLPGCDREIGVDLGLNSLIVTSDGEVIPDPRFLRTASKRLGRAQRVLSRRQKGSANRAKARRRVAVLHRKVRETRLDHAHKVALRLVRDNQAVYAEDLAVNGLMRTRL